MNTTNEPAGIDLDNAVLDKLEALARKAYLANEVVAMIPPAKILDLIAQARASQPEGATGTTGASIDTLEFQSLAGTWCGAAQSCDQWTRTIGAKQAWADLITYIDAIIIDLRAQLAAKCEEANAWSERWLKEKQLAAKGQGEPIYQWRQKAVGSYQPAWYDATKEEAYARVDDHYEARTVYLAAPASAQPDRGAAQDDNGFRKALEEIAAMRGKGDCASDLIDIADSALAGLYATSPASQPVAPEATQADAEFLSVRLARVARAAGVTMPEGSHDFIAGVAGTILGDIARKLESAPSHVNGATACQWPTCLSEVEQDNLADEVMRLLAGEPAVASSDAKDAAPTTVPDHSEREAVNAGGLTLQQLADGIADQGVMSWREFRAFMNGDGVDMYPHQLLRMVNLFAHRSPATVEDKTIAAGQEAANAKDAARVTYTCKGKGGVYSLIGVAYGAGTSRDTTVNLYREVGTGVMYFRTPADFHDRMERINAAMAAVGAAGQEGGDK